MLVKDINFNDLKASYLCIFINDVNEYEGLIGDVLKQIPHLTDKSVKSTNYYFNEFIVRI